MPLGKDVRWITWKDFTCGNAQVHFIAVPITERRYLCRALWTSSGRVRAARALVCMALRTVRNMRSGNQACSMHTGHTDAERCGGQASIRRPEYSIPQGPHSPLSPLLLGRNHADLPVSHSAKLRKRKRAADAAPFQSGATRSSIKRPMLCGRYGRCEPVSSLIPRPVSHLPGGGCDTGSDHSG